MGAVLGLTNKYHLYKINPDCLGGVHFGFTFENLAIVRASYCQPKSGNAIADNGRVR